MRWGRCWVKFATNEMSALPPENAKWVRLPDYRMTAGELAKWDRRVNREASAQCLRDPLWRLTHLYKVTNENGKVVTYQPTDEQKLVIWGLVVRGWKRLIIPKARQLGMSLTLCLIMLDAQLFNAGFNGAWIDKKAPDAIKKLKEKILFAFDRLPPGLLGKFKVMKRDEAAEFTVCGPALDGLVPTPSSVQVGISFRGGTVEFLVISEWGWIQANDILRSKEINDGALPAVERAADGVCVIETTWEGDLSGDVGKYVKEALSMAESEKGPKSWRILFFGWQTNPLYRQAHGHIDVESAQYFADIEALGVQLDHEQKLWYAEKRRTSNNIKGEYPTLVHECWTSAPKGSIYGSYIEKARGEGRVCNFLVDHRWPVDTFWDCGHPLNTVCWLVITKPSEICWIGVEMGLDITLEDRKARLDALGYNFRYHFLPWEADETGTTGKPSTEYRRVLGPGVRIVPKIANVWHGISAMRSLFARFVFHAEKCEAGLEHLARYWSRTETTTGVAVDKPVHDKYSHAADAARQYAQASQAGMIPNSNTVTPAAVRSATPQVVRAY